MRKKLLQVESNTCNMGHEAASTCSSNAKHPLRVPWLAYQFTNYQSIMANKTTSTFSGFFVPFLYWNHTRSWSFIFLNSHRKQLRPTYEDATNYCCFYLFDIYRAYKYRCIELHHFAGHIRKNRT